MLWMMKAVIATSIFVIGRNLVFVIEPKMRDADKEQPYAFYVGIFYIVFSSFVEQGEAFHAIMGCFFWGSLVLAAYSDYLTTDIYDFVFVPALAASVIRFLVNGFHGNTFTELIIFCVLQLLLFSRMYGLADCFAFIICAAYMAASGAGIMEYVIHMAITFSLVTAVQAWKRNINARGNLKKPIALVPYIAVSMLFMQIMK